MINSELKHTDFSRYTFEEFLQNDFFISSVKYPTEEIQEFWDRFEKSTPSNICLLYTSPSPRDCS